MFIELLNHLAGKIAGTHVGDQWSLLVGKRRANLLRFVL
jgi:hypothetical protein